METICSHHIKDTLIAYEHICSYVNFSKSKSEIYLGLITIILQYSYIQ